MISNKKLNRAFRYKWIQHYGGHELSENAEKRMASSICNTYHIHRGCQKRKVLARVTELMKPHRLKLLLVTGSLKGVSEEPKEWQGFDPGHSGGYAFTGTNPALVVIDDAIT